MKGLIMDITVYHGNGCRACHEEMEYLKHKDVKFVAKNVHDDPEARKELIALGSKTIPTTVIGNEVVVGFEVDRIKELVGL
jgi:glutaredoxin